MNKAAMGGNFPIKIYPGQCFHALLQDDMDGIEGQTFFVEGVKVYR